MPRGDGTGPAGMGPMTGRRAGFCAGYATPGFLNPVLGTFPGAIGLGGFGRGRGWRQRYYATGLPWWARTGAVPAGAAPQAGSRGTPNETLAVKAQIDYLRGVLSDLEKRLTELEPQPTDQ